MNRRLDVVELAVSEVIGDELVDARVVIMRITDESVFEFGFRMDGDFGYGRARQGAEELTRPEPQITAGVDVVEVDELRHALGIVRLDFVVKPAPKQILQSLPMDISANRYHGKSEFPV